LSKNIFCRQSPGALWRAAAASAKKTFAESVRLTLAFHAAQCF
jgi:hypothetical protein